MFGVKPGDNVIERLIQRDKVLSEAAFDDDILLSLLDDIESLDNLSSWQKQHVRLDFIYLKNLYEIAIQNMNSFTWTECSIEAISVLCDAGFTHKLHNRSLRDLNMKYRVNEKLHVPLSVSKSKPIIFEIIPEFKDKIVRFCNEQVAEGTLSVDGLKKEITRTLLPVSYSEYIRDHNKCNTNVLPSYPEFLSILHLRGISHNTVHRWMQFLGYVYSKTKNLLH